MPPHPTPVGAPWESCATIAALMTRSALALIDLLDPAQRGGALLPFTGDGHRDWDYQPGGVAAQHPWRRYALDRPRPNAC